MLYTPAANHQPLNNTADQQLRPRQPPPLLYVALADQQYTPASALAYGTASCAAQPIWHPSTQAPHKKPACSLTQMPPQHKTHAACTNKTAPLPATSQRSRGQVTPAHCLLMTLQSSAGLLLELWSPVKLVAVLPASIGPQQAVATVACKHHANTSTTQQQQ